MKRYKIRINQEKLNKLKEQIAPSKSWWGLIGIIFFFFIPEIIAYFYGDLIKEYFAQKVNLATSNLERIFYEQLKSLGENSYLNIILGIVFTIWFFKARRD